MLRVWSLYKWRVIAVIFLALTAGYSLTAWLYFQFERHSVITFGSMCLYIGILGLLVSAVLFFFTAQFVVTPPSSEGPPSDGDDDDFFAEDAFDAERRGWLIDPWNNALDWGGHISTRPGGAFNDD